MDYGWTKRLRQLITGSDKLTWRKKERKRRETYASAGIVRQSACRAHPKKGNISRRWPRTDKEDAELSTLKLMVGETSSSGSENMRNKTRATAHPSSSSRKAGYTLIPCNLLNCNTKNSISHVILRAEGSHVCRRRNRRRFRELTRRPLHTRRIKRAQRVVVSAIKSRFNPFVIPRVIRSAFKNNTRDREFVLFLSRA